MSTSTTTTDARQFRGTLQAMYRKAETATGAELDSILEEIDEMKNDRIDDLGVAAAKMIREMARLSDCSIADALEAVEGQINAL